MDKSDLSILVTAARRDRVGIASENLALDKWLLGKVCDLALTANIALTVIDTLKARNEPHFHDVLVQAENRVLNKWIPHFHRLKKSLSAIETAFTLQRINFIVMRGLDFAERYYPNPLLRVCSDLDILVAVEDRMKALEVLRDLGFHEFREIHFLQAQSRFINQVELSDQGVVIDLNWSLKANGQNGGKSENIERIWERSRSSATSSRRHFSDEDYLLHVIRHIAQGHEFDAGVFRGFVDVDQVLTARCHQLDMDYVVNASVECGCRDAFLVFAELYSVFYHNTKDGPLSYRRMRIENDISISFVAYAVWWNTTGKLRGYGRFCEQFSRNFSFFLKYCTTDTIKDLAFIAMQTIVYPKADVIHLLDEEHNVAPLWWKRIRVYYGVGVLMLPGIVLGIMFRFVRSIVRLLKVK